MKYEELFKTCAGCGAPVSIKFQGEDYCPKCIGNRATFDALTETIIRFCGSLESQGYDRIEVRGALENASDRFRWPNTPQ